MKKFFKEFSDFINKGNAIELAVGIIIGSMFTAIINSIVDGLFKPLIELIPGSNGVSLLKIVLREATETQPAVILDIAGVISAVLTFVITAFVLFCLLKGVNTLRERSNKLKEKVVQKINKKDSEAEEKKEE